MTSVNTRRWRSRDDGLAKGFTLIELLLVLAILAALAVIVVPRLTGHGKKAKITAAVQGISNLKTCLQSFEIHCGRFPTTSEGLGALAQNPGIPDWQGPYVEQQTVPLDPWQNEYRYRSPGQHNNDFDLYSIGPDCVDGTEDDITNWSH